MAKISYSIGLEGKRMYTCGPCPSGDTYGQDENKFINKISDEKFKDINNSSIKSCTMFKVNVWLRESNPDAYTPKMVSIGPYHNEKPQLHPMEKPQLHPMEKYKSLYLQRFLGRKEGLDRKSCVKELEGLKKDPLKCYDDEEKCVSIEMLMIDGCFVVEFIRECCGICPEEEDKFSKFNNVHIFRDLMLLENQLPFFILNKLHDMTKRDNEPPLATLLARKLDSLPFVKLPEMTFGSFLEITGGNIKHLLHLKHAISCHGNHTKKPKDAGGCRHLGHAGNGKDNDDQTWHMVMPNATELSEAGVSFAKASFKTSIFDSIKFENGLMTIPQFRVTDDTETLLRNLIAYEQQSDDVHPKHFSNFAIFMDKLIESDKDVNLLCHKGIIENWLGDDKEVANLFNKIGNGVLTMDCHFYYEEECRKAVKHCKKPWNKYRASLLRNYFSSPWVGASTVAAIVLVLLTLAQTVLAFIDLFNK